MIFEFGTLKHVDQGSCPIGVYAWAADTAVEAWNRRATPSRNDILREAAKVADELTGYTGEGTEDRNDGFGMFARGVRHAKRKISAGILSLSFTLLGHSRPAMAKKPDPIPGDDLDVGDQVVLRAEVTRMAKRESGGWDVTVLIDGFSQSRITLPAEFVEKAEG